MSSPSKRQTSHKLYSTALVLAIGGGVAFWATTVATSLLPIAPGYRAAGSNWRSQSVRIGAPGAGMVLGACVSYSFRLPGLQVRLPAQDLGIVLMVHCCTWLSTVFLSFLFPGFTAITYVSYPLGFIAEMGLTLWRVVMGAKARKPAPVGAAA